MTMRAGRNSRNADFISIAAERQSTTLGAKGPVKPKNPPANGRSILRTLTPQACPKKRQCFPKKGSTVFFTSVYDYFTCI